jgi:hypothetical protein
MALEDVLKMEPQITLSSVRQQVSRPPPLRPPVATISPLKFPNVVTNEHEQSSDLKTEAKEIRFEQEDGTLTVSVGHGALSKEVSSSGAYGMG